MFSRSATACLATLLRASSRPAPFSASRMMSTRLVRPMALPRHGLGPAMGSFSGLKLAPARSLRGYAEGSPQAHNPAPAFSPHPGAVAAPVSTATMLQPDAVIINISAKGVYMGHLSVSRMLVGSWMAGVFLSFGCSLMVQVAGIPFAVPGLHLFLGALVFPVGLTLITWHGADLLTGCYMYSFMPFLTKAVPADEAARNLAKVWTTVFVGNFIGCVSLALIGGALTNPATATFAASLAVKKTSLGFGVVFLKAIGANFLVCTAMAGAMATQTPGGKLLCIWLPISTFVALGLEHSIANMFLIPLGMHFSNVTVYDFLVGNLVPSTLGNIVGAWVFATAMWLRHRRH
eukprot:RCo033781